MDRYTKKHPHKSILSFQIYVHTHACMCVNIYIYMCIYIYRYICTYVCIYIYIYVIIYLFLCVCVCVCRLYTVYIHTYIHTYIHISFPNLVAGISTTSPQPLDSIQEVRMLYLQRDLGDFSSKSLNTFDIRPHCTTEATGLESQTAAC